MTDIETKDLLLIAAVAGVGYIGYKAVNKLPEQLAAFGSGISTWANEFGSGIGTWFNELNANIGKFGADVQNGFNDFLNLNKWDKDGNLINDNNRQDGGSSDAGGSSSGSGSGKKTLTGGQYYNDPAPLDKFTDPDIIIQEDRKNIFGQTINNKRMMERI